MFADEPEVLSNLVGNPLPASVEIWLADSANPNSVAARLSVLQGVDEVKPSTVPED